MPLSNAIAFLLHNRNVDMIYLRPRIRLREMCNYHDAWTQPSRTPVPMQTGPCYAPRHAIWPMIPLPCLTPLDTAMDIEVTPILFNSPHRELLGRDGPNQLTGPILLQDNGTMQVYGEKEKILVIMMRSIC